MIVVRACKRRGAGDGFDLLRRTLAEVDREGGRGVPRVIVFDHDTPDSARGIPDGWRSVVSNGARGSRASLWRAFETAYGTRRPVLFLEDDITLSPFATDLMLSADMRGVPLVSFFYPVFAQRHERARKARRPCTEDWSLANFGYSQAMLVSPTAVNAVVSNAFWPAPPLGGPHGGDGALRSALFKAGYDTHRVVWPSLVQHVGTGELSVVEGRPDRVVVSDYYAGDSRAVAP